MSTKTIAVELGVYRKLASLKGESESFSKLLDRLVDRTVTAHTVTRVLARLDTDLPALTDSDATVMERVVRENREGENWPRHDLP